MLKNVTLMQSHKRLSLGHTLFRRFCHSRSKLEFHRCDPEKKSTVQPKPERARNLNALAEIDDLIEYNVVLYEA